MGIFNQEDYLLRQEVTHTTPIYNIFQKQKKDFIQLLENEEKRFFQFEQKAIFDEVNLFLNRVKSQVPKYLVSILPKIMDIGYKVGSKDYSKLLPHLSKNLNFNVSTSPARRYLDKIETLHLSQRDGSILNTTNREILNIIKEGVSQGKSYGEMAKEIREQDPFVFSKARAQLIAVQEIGQAYGWANHQPALEMQRNGYVLEKLWVTSHDKKVRPSHQRNEAQGWIPLNQIWIATGDEFAPSKDFRCRCYQKTRMVGIKQKM